MSLADDILSRWAPVMRTVELKPGEKGRFEVSLNGELLFSKATLKRHAEKGEVVGIFEQKLGPPLRWRNG